MVKSSTDIAARETRDDERRDLPSLVEKLGGDLSKLFDQKLALLKIEVKEEVDEYVRGSILILAGGIVAGMALALANIALAFAVSTLFVNTSLSQPAKYALGFVATGVAYLVIGGVVIFLAKNRLAKQGLVPKRTVRELEKDKQWLQREL
jgi:uncharacterized membrane protein YqjE